MTTRRESDEDKGKSEGKAKSADKGRVVGGTGEVKDTSQPEPPTTDETEGHYELDEATGDQRWVPDK